MSSEMIHAEVEKLRGMCIGCGRCTVVCPSFKHGGLDPAKVMTGDSADMSLCICCGNCSKTCRNTDPAKVMMDLIAIDRDMHPSEMFRKTGYVAPVPDNAPEPEWTGDDVLVMPGCIAKCKVPYVVSAMASGLKGMGFGAAELKDNTCCLHPVQFRDMSDDDRDSYLFRMRESSQGKEIITLCAGCSERFNDTGIDADHIIRFLARHIDRLPKFDEPLKVGMEPGCAAMPFADEMRKVLEAMNCAVVNTEYGCCGKGTPIAGSLMDERIAECRGSDWIVVGCPMCQVKYDQQKGVRSVHISELVAMASGDRSSLDHHINR